MPTTASLPDRLHYAGDEEADRLIARDPLALLIGFVLDQQVTVQKAFQGPLELGRRLGRPLDPGDIAGMDPDELLRLFIDRPALHRFPGAMAVRVQALCAIVADTYGGDASRIWREAADGKDLLARLRQLPGVGPTKAESIAAVLAKRFRLELPGLAEVLPMRPTLGDVDSEAALAQYQAGKRAMKAAARAAASASKR